MRPTKTLPFILIFTAAIVANIRGQEVVAAAGDHHTIPGYAVSWTLGESVIATGNFGEVNLTQGMHQSEINVTRIDPVQGKSRVEVYPNPASAFVIIQNSHPEDELHYALYTISGERLLEGRFRGEQARLNLEGQVSGTYLLELRGEGEIPPETFRIIKR